MIEFARLGLLIVILAFSVQANERAKKFVRERRMQRVSSVVAAAASAAATAQGEGTQGCLQQERGDAQGRELFVEIVHPESALFQYVLPSH